MKTRFFIIVAAITLLLIILVAYAASPKTAPTPKPTPTPEVTAIPTKPPPTTLSFTLKSGGAGINTVTVTNQNSGATIILTAADLPSTFNFKNGDTLTFKVSANEGYRFNAWVFGDGTFQSQNPYSIKASATFIMEARFLMEAQ